MKIIRVFLSENFQFWKVKCSIYLNRRVFVMLRLPPNSQLCSAVGPTTSVDIQTTNIKNISEDTQEMPQSRSTDERRGNEQEIMRKQMLHMKPQTYKVRRTATKKPL